MGRPERENPSQRNTPLVIELCEGQITVTDPGHPLFGKVLKLFGLACLPGHIRHCQVELVPGQIGYIPISSTSRSPEPRPQPSVLTAAAVEELVAIFQAIYVARRTKHANRNQSARVGASASKRTQRRQRGDRSHPHGGGGK